MSSACWLRGRQLRRVPLLAVHELGQEPQGGLLQQRVELRQLRAGRGDQRRLELAVRDVEVAGRGRRAVEQRRQLRPGAARILLELRDPLVQPGGGLRVVVQVVREQALRLEPRLARQVRGGQVHELAQHVREVGQAARALLDVGHGLRSLRDSRTSSSPVRALVAVAPSGA